MMNGAGSKKFKVGYTKSGSENSFGCGGSTEVLKGKYHRPFNTELWFQGRWQ